MKGEGGGGRKDGRLGWGQRGKEEGKETAGGRVCGEKGSEGSLD